MTRKSALLAAAMLGLVANPHMAIAEEPVAIAQAESNYERLLDTLSSDEIASASAESAIRAMLRLVIEQNPVFADIDEREPEFRTDFVARFLPIFKDLVQDSHELGKPQKIIVMQGVMSAEEAGRLADLYATPFGQRILLETVNNLRYERTLNVENAKDPIDPADLSADLDEATREMAKGRKFDQADQITLFKITSDPAFKKLQSVQGELQAISAEIENRQISPEIEERMTAIYLSILEDYTEE